MASEFRADGACPLDDRSALIRRRDPSQPVAAVPNTLMDVDRPEAARVSPSSIGVGASVRRCGSRPWSRSARTTRTRRRSGHRPPSIKRRPPSSSSPQPDPVQTCPRRQCPKPGMVPATGSRRSACAVVCRRNRRPTSPARRSTDVKLSPSISLEEAHRGRRRIAARSRPVIKKEDPVPVPEVQRSRQRRDRRNRLRGDRPHCDPFSAMHGCETGVASAPRRALTIALMRLLVGARACCCSVGRRTPTTTRRRPQTRSSDAGIEAARCR